MTWPTWLKDVPERREQARQLGLSRRTHGMQKTPTWNSWRAMKERCNNPRHCGYKYYGERGVGYDPRWSRFEEFLADMGVRPEGTSLDRINTDGHYGPDNCRWADAQTQSANRRARKAVGV